MGSIIGSYKSAVSKRINLIRNEHYCLWQRNYYEHIFRDENDHLAIYDHIRLNLLIWEMDEKFSLSAETPHLLR
ncbi:MAG: hypothetical protein MUO40_07385 [Anaerolineaceae bacterium]|nr:hypothetical protein [Anaerolineaceae bacterium]